MLRFRKPSPALVISVIALFVALGGTGYAALKLPKNSVGTPQLKNGAVTSAKLKNGAVTSAKLKNGAVTAGKINPAGLTVPDATHASTADSATTAGSAPPSGSAGGALAGTYPNPTLAAPQAWQEIGATGQPAFQNGWTNESPGDEVTAAFYKDPYGVVHLKGLITSGTDNLIFTLPAGYRPGKNLVELVFRTSGVGELIIYSDGDVDMASGTGSADLDGVTFTAGE